MLRWNKWYVTIRIDIIDVHINDARELSIDLISINWRTLFMRSALRWNLWNALSFYLSVLLLQNHMWCLLKAELQKICTEN